MLESEQRRLKIQETWFAVALLTPLLLVASPDGQAAEAAPVEAGKSLYRVYCASCHGEAGKGDGATAAYLTIEPADLTKLSRGNQGKFPAERLREIIDGREAVRVHGSREMPLWGVAFQDWNADIGQEDAVREKIDQLLRYLESIQKK